MNVTAVNNSVHAPRNSSIGGIRLPNFNSDYVYTKKQSNTTNQDYKRKIEEQAYKDFANVNYLREVCQKPRFSQNYFSELSQRCGSYLQDIRQSQGNYGFDDIVTGTASAYASMYQEIVEGHQDGTREILDSFDINTGLAHFATLEEEQEALDRGFHMLVEWNQMVAKSRLQCAINRETFHGDELDDVLTSFDINDACNYIQETYSETRTSFEHEYSENRQIPNITTLVSSILQNKNPDMYQYCNILFENITRIS